MGIDLIIGLLVLFVIRVGDIAAPGEQAASAGRLVEVKVRLITLIQISRDFCRCLQCFIDRSSLRLNCSFFIAVAFALGFPIRAGIFLIDRRLEFRQLAFQDCTDRQGTQLTVCIGCEIKAGNRARLGVIEHQFRFGGIDTPALDLTNRLQRDLQETELHIIGVDLYGVAVIGSLQRQLGRFAVDRIQAVFGEFQFRRLDNVQRFCTQNASVRCNKLDLHITERFCREDITGQRTKAFVRHLQRGAFWKRDRASGRSNAGRLNGQIGPNRQIIIICRNDRMVEHIGGLRRRNDDEGGANRALITIRGTVHNGDRFRAFALGSKGRGAAAVQVHCGNAARILHDLRDLDGTAACREWLLPPVKHHQHNLPVIGNTNAGTGNTSGVIIICCIHDDLTIPDEPHGAADSFLDLALVRIPLGAPTNNGRSVLENAEEVFAAHAVILNALHNQGASGCTVTHVVKVRIDANDRTIIGNIMLRIVRVGVLFLSGVHLIRQTGHLPGRAVIVVIVCIDIDVAARNIGCRKIVSDLFVVLSQGHFDFLLNAGSQHGGGAGKDFVIIVLQLSLCRFVKIIGKSIAAGTAQIGIDTVWQIAALQRSDALIAIVSIIDRGSNVIFRRGSAEAVVQEEFCARSIGQIGREIILHDRADRHTGTDLLQDVKSVKISIQVENTKRVNLRIGMVVKKILVVICPDLLCHFLNGAGHTGIGRELKQVTNIACPAAEVGRALITGVIGHVHCAKHVRKIDLIPVGHRENSKAAQGSGICAVGCVLFRYIAGKSRVFRTTEGRPRAGRVFLHAAADVVDDKCRSIFAGMFSGVSVGVSLKCGQRS